MTIVAVLDTETTGVEKKDRVVEIAVVQLEVLRYMIKDRVFQTPRVIQMRSYLVKPGVPVSPTARAAHHISDQMLESALTMTELCEQGALEILSDADVVTAHNLEFDASMVEQSSPAGINLLPDRRVCTFQCAKHVFPNELSFSNQALRYSLGLELSDPSSPHRALPDALVTGLLLARMLASHTLEELEALTKLPALLARCPVGKYRGKPWAEVDEGMLRWILTKDFGEDVKYTAAHHLKTRGNHA